MNTGPNERTLCAFVFAICVAANLWCSSFGWTHNLHELHEFRQFQTALTARAIQQEGWSLAYPTPLFGPPWSAPLEFPFYQLCTAWVSSITDVPLERAGRLVSLSFLYLSLPAWFMLLRHLSVPSPRRWLFLALILVSPLYLYYSRAFMIESLALCAAAWFLHAYSRALESPTLRWIVGAFVMGAIAALAKITTFAVALVPAVFLTLHQLRQIRPPAQRNPWMFYRTATIGALIIGCAIAVGYAWIAFADGVKASNPLSAFLVSDRLRAWNYGSLAQRLDPNFWRSILTHSVAVLAPAGAVIGAMLFVWSAAATRSRTVVLMLCYVSGPLLFSNLYSVHDYYFYATGIYLLAVVMLGWNSLLDFPRLHGVIKWLLIILTLVAQLFSFSRTYFTVQTRGDIEEPELSRALNRITAQDDIVVFQGFMWNPSVAYDSGRRAIMVTDEYARNTVALDEVLNRVPPRSVGAMVVGGPMLAETSAVREIVRKLSLHEEPLLRSDEMQIFVADHLIAAAVPRIEAMRLKTLELQAPIDADYQGIGQRRYRVTDLPDASVIAMFLPRPSYILAPFPVSAAPVDGATAFNAHAPTEITINVPTGAQIIHADFGILPDAHSGKLKTDGVIFQIDLIASDGTSTSLFHRALTPANNVTDRGTQHCAINLPPDSTGARLLFRTLPGVANDITFDWAYWLKVEVK